ncbi:hypothetical protein Tco_1490053 [Tanacetum coccineum]
MDDEDQIIFLGIKDDDMDQRVEEPVDSEATVNNIIDEIADFKASTDKPSDPLGRLQNEVSSLSYKVENLYSSLAKKIIEDSFQHVLLKIDQRVHETLQSTMTGLISKPLNKELNALIILETQRFENLQKELITVIRKKVGKPIKKCVWKEMDIV